VEKFFIAFDPSLSIKEQRAAVKTGEQLGVQCLAQGHFNMQLWGEWGSNRVP